MLPLMIFASSVADVTQSWSDRTTISRIDRSYQEAVKRNDVKALGFTVTALILLGVGLVVGAVGSGLTLRRYLKV